MKKLLIMLMVVAMASFLFVGCFGDGVTPPVDDEDEDGVVTPPATVAPIITSVPDAADGYVNIAEAAGGMWTYGTGPTYSEIKLYIDGIFAGTGDVLETGAWSVYVAKADIIRAVKADGAKILVAKATDLGLPESDASNEIKYTLDTIRPFIDGAVAHKGTGLVYKFVETADSMAVALGGAPGSALALFTEVLVNTGTALINAVAGTEWTSIPLTGTQLGEQILTPFATIPAAAINRLLPGVVDWKIQVIGFGVNDTTVTVKVSNLTAVTSQDYTFDNSSGQATSISWIQGLAVTGPVKYSSLTDIGAYVLITTTNTAASAGHVDVTFNEPVKAVTITQSVAAGTTWTLFGATTAIPNTRSVRSPTVARLTELTPGMLIVGTSFSVGVFGIEDLASNIILSTAPSSFVGVIIP